MKKKCIWHTEPFPCFTKTWKIMRLSVFFLFVIVAQSWALDSYSQVTRLSLDMKDARVIDVLGEIENKTEFFFLFNQKLLDVERRVDIEVRQRKIEDILDELFAGTNVNYLVMNRQIVLTTAQPGSEEYQQQTAMQQQGQVTGKVTDRTGAPLPGVTVVVKGTTAGTITNNAGTFSINNLPENATIVFSFVGMRSVEVSTTGKTAIDVVMYDQTIGIEEVVAIGYGTLKKSDLTGAVVSVNMAKKEMAANVNLSQALQGYIPGVNVGGAVRAGESGSLSIRGRTSLSASDSPLIVLDGIIYNRRLADIDVNDIERIDILKDASAAAVYGSRSANGVIIISTKRGESEKPLFSFNTYYGMQEMAPNKMAEVMNADQYAVRMVDYYYYQQKLLPWYKTFPTSSELRPLRPDVQDKTLVSLSLRSLEEQQNYLKGYEVNWFDLVLKKAPIQNYSLSVSGKTNTTSYYLSGSYVNQEGIIQNDNFERISLRANFDNKITDWLTLGMNISLSRLDNSGFSADMTDVLRASPLANVYDENGNYPIFLTGENYQKHPLLGENIIDSEISNAIFVNLYSRIAIPYIKGLTYEINYSDTYSNNKRNNFYPKTTAEGASKKNYGTKNHSEEDNWLVNNILNYSKILNEKHSVNLTFLYSAESREFESSNLDAYDFDNPVLGYNSLQSGKFHTVKSNAWEEASISYMARINYAYNNRYLVTATYRRDGFSGFGKNNKYASFPSVSAGWVVSEESFMEKVSWLDYLKFRISYGMNGNQGIGRYSSLSRVSNSEYVFGSNSFVGVYPETMGNSNLSWESTGSTNLGLDFKILDQRISAEIDLYKAVTTDVLVRRTLPMMSGYDVIWTNIGGIENNGVEIGITSVNLKKPNLNWESRLIFSLNRDEITKLYGGENDFDLGNSWFVGKPISAIYNYFVDGVWQEEELYNKTILANYYPGMYKLRDLNADGKIAPADDRAIVGYQTPNYRFGINNTISFKNFSFNFFLNSIQGGNGYYMDNNYGAIVAGGTDFEYRANRPGSHPYWRPDQPVNDAPAMFYSPPQQHGVYQEKSFVRLQDVSVTYNFSEKVLGRIGLKSLQLYASGKNLYTWSKWSGWDPESSNAPIMRSVIGGIKTSF
jgi:TonB-dependent starch-binding outer membrane protein SusC